MKILGESKKNIKKIKELEIEIIGQNDREN